MGGGGISPVFSLPATRSHSSRYSSNDFAVSCAAKLTSPDVTEALWQLTQFFLTNEKTLAGSAANSPIAATGSARHFQETIALLP